MWADDARAAFSPRDDSQPVGERWARGGGNCFAGARELGTQVYCVYSRREQDLEDPSPSGAERFTATHADLELAHEKKTLAREELGEVSTKLEAAKRDVAKVKDALRAKEEILDQVAVFSSSFSSFSSNSSFSSPFSSSSSFFLFFFLFFILFLFFCCSSTSPHRLAFPSLLEASMP